MSEHDHHHENKHEGHDDHDHDDHPIKACCCCACYTFSSITRGVGRCLFVACYPVLRCCGLDEYKHRHADHHRRHFR
ncbi:hypothetical protein ACMD2_06199 [Ananas comosus]|uniref:Uncharacterized protein n=1 Tax=Ananas comosus TaxID=4615 RepID=A0A199UPZ1_ANACO|nr:hypothetical protein ACMD2_06199 [Ananas comosus]